jgi:hypothetical protein
LSRLAEVAHPGSLLWYYVARGEAGSLRCLVRVNHALYGVDQHKMGENLRDSPNSSVPHTRVVLGLSLVNVPSLDRRERAQLLEQMSWSKYRRGQAPR